MSSLKKNFQCSKFDFPVSPFTPDHALSGLCGTAGMGMAHQRALASTSITNPRGCSAVNFMALLEGRRRAPFVSEGPSASSEFELVHQFQGAARCPSAPGP
ncbi:hypothetical protein NDU88_000833 [Pleurodeles waltl]|uniref:Uncharacterized protein n=1 Tax=Pleurodeles waltl TaxID=8319 RepID=A0AAV7V654_PLEWA|nr:hypothetical protein NDU88_000833 [Pleurodeles waltl]